MFAKLYYCIFLYTKVSSQILKIIKAIMFTIWVKKNFNRNWRGQRWIFKHPPPIYRIRGLHSIKRAKKLQEKREQTGRYYVSILEDLFRRSAIGNLQVIPPTSKVGQIWELII